MIMIAVMYLSSSVRYFISFHDWRRVIFFGVSVKFIIIGAVPDWLSQESDANRSTLHFLQEVRWNDSWLYHQKDVDRGELCRRHVCTWWLVLVKPMGAIGSFAKKRQSLWHFLRLVKRFPLNAFISQSIGVYGEGSEKLKETTGSKLLILVWISGIEWILTKQK